MNSSGGRKETPLHFIVLVVLNWRENEAGRVSDEVLGNFRTNGLPGCCRKLWGFLKLKL